ncbi:MAG: hypothetical protein BGP04_06125 [Rhizobiales bacterium 62-17]|nr:helix-turn-helix domain-containing protein [Hyphomicrobiales bacterium]OJY01797.1 MAG: hypothetical protein BGP04_06125 [Rhizobiales bacterium 62-17]
MSAAEQVRALYRGLDILEFLGTEGPSSLHQIHLGTRLPKSSLRRLLATLVERRFVRVGLTDGMYRSNIATLQAVNPRDSVLIARLVEVARPHMLDLTQAVQWPVNLHFFVNGRMRVIESTHGRSPFNHATGGDVEVEVNIFVAASGLAYLACLKESEVLDIVKLVQDDELASAERYGVTPKMLKTMLEQVRKSGYGTRKAPQLRKLDRRAIAVAVHNGQRPVGALAIIWPKKLMDEDEFAALHLEKLQRAAAAISAQLGSTVRARSSSPGAQASVSVQP